MARTERGKASPDARAPGWGEGPRVRRVRGEGSGGSGGVLRGFGEEGRHGCVIELHSYKDNKMCPDQPLTHDLSDVSALGHAPRARALLTARSTHCDNTHRRVVFLVKYGIVLLSSCSFSKQTYR